MWSRWRPRFGELDGHAAEVGRGRGGRRGLDVVAGRHEERDQRDEHGEARTGEAGGGHRLGGYHRRPEDADERDPRRRPATGRGPGAWRRGGGPSCRPRRRGPSESSGRWAAAVTGAAGGADGGWPRAAVARSGRAVGAAAGWTGRRGLRPPPWSSSPGWRPGRRCPGPGRWRRGDPRRSPFAGPAARRRRRRPPSQPRAADQLAPPERHPPQRDVQRPQQERDDQQQRPQLGEAVRAGEVVDPRVGGGRRRRCRPWPSAARRGTARWRPAAGTRPRSARPARPSARAATCPAASG